MKAATMMLRTPLAWRRIQRGGSSVAPTRRRSSCTTSALNEGGPNQVGDKENRLRRMLKVKLSRKETDAVVKSFSALGLDTPRKVRSFLLKTSSLRALLLSADAGINAIGAVCAWATFRMLMADATSSFSSTGTLDVGLALTYTLAATAAFGTGWFTSSIAADVLVLTMTLWSALRFGVSADAFLETAVGAPAGPLTAGVRRNPLDSARAAQAAVTTAAKLEDAMKALQQQQSNEVPSSLTSLRSYFALTQAEERGFKPESVALSEGDMISVARSFAACDADDDGQLSVGELRVLLSDMTRSPCSEEDALTAMLMLDTDGDGKLSLEEFSRWWSEVRQDAAHPSPK